MSGFAVIILALMTGPCVFLWRHGLQEGMNHYLDWLNEHPWLVGLQTGVILGWFAGILP